MAGMGGLRHSPRPAIPLISVVPLAGRTVEAYRRSREPRSSPMARGNMPYIQISDDLRSLDSDLQESLEYQTATRFTHPPPRWGRAGVGVVMPRTDPW